MKKSGKAAGHLLPVRGVRDGWKYGGKNYPKGPPTGKEKSPSGRKVYAGEIERNRTGAPLKLFREYCGNPSCGNLVEAMLPPDELTPIPCSKCGSTLLIGSGEKTETALSGLPTGLIRGTEIDIVTPEFGCPACGHRWNQTFEAVHGAVHRIRCPNPDCPNHSILDYVVDVAPDSKTPATHQGEVRPNDRCPCGSGKKYKKCCGKP